MKQLIFSKILIFLVINNVLGQSDFREGFIIKNNNDTIYGYVDNRGNKANAFQCTFKKTMDSEPVEYSPKELKSYRLIDKKFYVSTEIIREDKMDTVFLEYLINGVLDFYYYRDEYGDHYLYNNGDGNFIELKTTIREIERDGRKYLIEKKEYVADLKNELKEVPTLAEKIPNISISHKSLISIGEEYHNTVCSDGECVIYEKKVGLKVDFGPLVQINVLSLLSNESYEEFTWREESKYYLSDLQGSSMYCSFGGYLNLYAPYFSERMYLGYETSIGKSTLNLTNHFTDDSDFYNIYTSIKVSQLIFSNSLNVGFVFPDRTYQPFIQFGGFYNVLNFKDFQRESARYNRNGDYYDTEYSDLNPFENRDYGFSAGIGCNRKVSERLKLHFETRYCFGLGWSHYNNSSNIKFGFGVEF